MKTSKKNASKKTLQFSTLQKAAVSNFLHDTEAYRLTFKEFSSRVIKALKNKTPVMGPTAKWQIVVKYQTGNGIKTVAVTPLYFHQYILLRPLVKETKSGGSVHPAVNSKQVIQKVQKHLAPLGWVTAGEVSR